jgi:hypothetical protein
MNWKRVWLTALLVFIALQITNIIIHSVIMMHVYDSEQVKAAFRTLEEMNRFMWVFYVTGAVFSFFFAFFFAKGYEHKGLAEGIRFGFYIGIFFYYVSTFNEFVIFPIPYKLVWYWIIGGVTQTIILGIIAALIYKPKPSQWEATA